MGPIGVSRKQSNHIDIRRGKCCIPEAKSVDPLDGFLHIVGTARNDIPGPPIDELREIAFVHLLFAEIKLIREIGAVSSALSMEKAEETIEKFKNGTLN